jgi:hypothetical protein
MRVRLLAVFTLVLSAWVLSVAHAMPIDADGPNGLSDNADFDDLIVSLTSPTAATTPVLVVIAAVCSVATDTVVLLAPSPVCSAVLSYIESRAPPLA